MYTYRIYPNRGPVLYFLRDIFDPASKRSQPLFEAGLYYFIAPARVHAQGARAPFINGLLSNMTSRQGFSCNVLFVRGHQIYVAQLDCLSGCTILGFSSCQHRSFAVASFDSFSTQFPIRSLNVTSLYFRLDIMSNITLDSHRSRYT